VDNCFVIFKAIVPTINALQFNNAHLFALVVPDDLKLSVLRYSLSLLLLLSTEVLVL
jgi:hypothetical protein